MSGMFSPFDPQAGRLPEQFCVRCESEAVFKLQDKAWWVLCRHCGYTRQIDGHP
jgi:hypothetical protein